MTEFDVGLVRCNEQRHILAETLDAIAQSTCKPARIVIIDNGDTPLAADPLMADLAARIDIVHRPLFNVGCAGAWNLLYQRSNSQRMVILNTDCAVAPDTFERMLATPAPAVVLAYYRRRMKLADIVPDEWPFSLEAVVVPGRERVTTGITHGSFDPDGYQGWREDKLAWFWRCYEANKQRYTDKWGGEPQYETFVLPFDGAEPVIGNARHAAMADRTTDKMTDKRTP